MSNYNLIAAKAAAKEFMQAFHHDREWWIVGGAIRDHECRRPFKDIDIFIQGFASDLLPEGCDDLGDKNAYLLRAYTVKEYKYMGESFEINLIFMRGDFWTLEAMADRCDFGICQIGWDPVDDRTYRSDTYVEDMLDQTLTLCRETTQERVGRMKDKFPFHTFENPDEITVDGKRCWSYDSKTQTLLVNHERVQPK